VHSVGEVVVRLAADGLLVVGIGNPLRGDDAAGLLLGQALAAKLGVRYLQVEDVPENYLAELRLTEAKNILLVDAADMQAPAGTIRIVEPRRLSEVSLSTHKSSLRLLCDMLADAHGKQVLLLGVQPATLEWGEPISAPVAQAVNAFVDGMSAFRVMAEDEVRDRS
jgi:hydrogenase maturation protease